MVAGDASRRARKVRSRWRASRRRTATPLRHGDSFGMRAGGADDATNIRRRRAGCAAVGAHNRARRGRTRRAAFLRMTISSPFDAGANADAARAAAIATRRSQRAVASLFGALGFSYGTWTSRLPEMKANLGLSTSQVSV